MKTYLPGETPLGRQVLVDHPMETPPVTIVGVVRNTRYSTVKEEAAEPIVYLPDTQRPRATRTVFAARAAGDTGSARAAIVRALGRAYPSLALVRVRTFGEQLNERLATERLLSILSSAFGSVGLVLAATRLVRAHLFGLSPTDPWTIAGSVVAVAAISSLAADVPARRASRIPPTEALRCE